MVEPDLAAKPAPCATRVPSCSSDGRSPARGNPVGARYGCARAYYTSPMEKKTTQAPISTRYGRETLTSIHREAIVAGACGGRGDALVGVGCRAGL